MPRKVSFSIPTRRLPERLLPTTTTFPTAPVLQPGSAPVQPYHKRPRQRRRLSRWDRPISYCTILLGLTLLWLLLLTLHGRNQHDPDELPHRSLLGKRTSNQIFPFLRALGNYSHVDPLSVLSSEEATGYRLFHRDNNGACTPVVRDDGTTSRSVDSPSGYRFDVVPSESGHVRHIPQTTAINGCVVSHKYKFIYIHVLKSGGMTVKSFLKKALCGDTSIPCRRGTDVLQVANCDQVFRHSTNLHDYLVWSVVRNPFSRMYSGYAMAKAFAAKGQSVEFSDFVIQRDLRSSYSSTDVVHYQPQYEFLFSRDGCPLVDCVLRLETIHRDLEQLLHVLGCPELSQFYETHGLERATDTDYGRRHMFDNLQTLDDAFTGLLQDAVVREYARDFETFGYDTFQLPS